MTSKQDPGSTLPFGESTTGGRRGQGSQSTSALRHHGSDVSVGMAPPLQNFLSHFGVLGASATLVDTSDTDNWETIFESSFDLTEERLKYVFQTLATDENRERISYDNLRRGLQLHTAEMEQSKYLLDDAFFQELVQILDADQSQDINFEEFSQGIRLIMLRSLFQEYLPNNHQQEWVEVLDYDATRLQRQVVSHNGGRPSSSGGQEDIRLGTTAIRVQNISWKEFYFQDRPSWINTRWINVSGPQSSLTLKRLAVRHQLHPLALEDALSSDHHRPKAEVYSNHYFIMIPIFCVTSLTKEEPQKVSWSRRKSRRRQTKTRPHLDESNFIRIGKIQVQMSSLFVNVPKDDTIITYNPVPYITSTGPQHAPQMESQNRHCWRRVQEELEKNYSKLRQYNAQYLTYALLDQAVDLLEPIIKNIRKELTHEKEWALTEKYKNLDRIHHLQTELEKVARKLKPFIRLLVHVIEDDAISPGATVYLRDVLDNLECHDDDVRQLIVECEKIDEASDKFRSRQMDQTLYTLTIISAVFLPAQFLTGVWGMNFEYMPELDERWGYRMFWGISVFVMISLVIVLNFGRL